MEKDFNNDNSKKLIIGVSILFCTVILIIGATTAFFTQSDSEEIGNIVSTDKVTLHYKDNVNYMFGDLIPIDEDKVEFAYKRDGNLKCKDDLGYNVCSIYQFTITNTGNVVQDILIDLFPLINDFHNLKFYLYDITNNKPLISKQELVYNSDESINLVNNLKLNTSNNISNTYELVFYILNDKDNDQSHLDAGVRFGANIKVNSVTTGEYVIEEVGDEEPCWIFDDEDPTKVNKFDGFDENGNVKTHCKKYFDQDEEGKYYIVNIESSYGGKPIKVLGNNLFNAVDGYDEVNDMPLFNKYQLIKEINVDDGIEIIEDGNFDEVIVTFLGIGLGIEDSNYQLVVNLPNSLTKIGNGAFAGSGLQSIDIPINVESIGDSAFSENSKLTKVNFLTNNGVSKLETIGMYAFWGCDLTYQEESKPLVIPANVTKIFYSAFGNNQASHENPNLNYIKYKGTNLINESWYDPENVLKLITTD